MNNYKGQRLKVARTAAGLSQKQLGERLNIDQAFVSRVEKGTNEGTVTFWCQAAKLLGVSLDYLLVEAPESDTPRLGEPLRMNKMAILADYTLAQGLRDLALDGNLITALGITDEEWTLLAAVPLPQTVTKAGYLQLLITLRSISPTVAD
jgi:transcriptional regulator with XRE-family HTH domain